jgi:hypothetical protein
MNFIQAENLLQIFSIKNYYVRFEVLATVIMKSSVFWDIMPCTLLKVNWHFGGTCCLHLQGQRISQASNQQERGSKEQVALLAACFMLVTCLVYSLTLKMEATCSSKMSAEVQWNTQHYITEERTLQKFICFGIIITTVIKSAYILQSNIRILPHTGQNISLFSISVPLFCKSLYLLAVRCIT